MAIPSDIRNLCRNPTAILSQYNSSGTRVIGYACSYVPEELIISAGLQPYRISNIGADASSLTPSFVCTFASAVLKNILELEGLFSGFVLAHTCDAEWRLYDILKKKTSKPIFLLRVPHNSDNQLSLDFFNAELLRFRSFLEESFEAKVDEAALSSSIELCNETRSVLKKIYMLNSAGRQSINAFDRFHLVLASMWMPKEEYNLRLKALDIDEDGGSHKTRLHVNGTAVYDLNLIKAIEQSGAFVASDDLCTGSRYFWDNVEQSQEPILALASRYLERTSCPSHSPLEKRLEYIDFMVSKFNVRGVLTLAERFCDPILYDVVHIRNMLAKRGIPTAVIDYENPAQEIGRIKTRVEAFVESLGD